MTGELCSLVPGEGSNELVRQPRDVLGEPLCDVLCRFVVELDEHSHPGLAFDERGHGTGASGTDDQVSFPVARHGPICNFSRSFGDVDHAWDPPRMTRASST